MRITLATVGTRGDIAPFVALGIGLMRAGHEVRALSWDLWREPFEAAGIDFTPAGPPTTDTAKITSSRGLNTIRPCSRLAITNRTVPGA